jgi:hypothetical protein
VLAGFFLSHEQQGRRDHFQCQAPRRNLAALIFAKVGQMLNLWIHKGKSRVLVLPNGETTFLRRKRGTAGGLLNQIPIQSVSSSTSGSMPLKDRKAAQAAAKKSWLNRDLPNWRSQVDGLLKGKQIIGKRQERMEFKLRYSQAVIGSSPFHRDFGFSIRGRRREKIRAQNQIPPGWKCLFRER